MADHRSEGARLPVGLPERVLVVGLGASGLAAARALARAGAQVRVVDASAGEQQRGRAAGLEGVDVQLGADLSGPELLEAVQLVVPSPGVPEASPLMRAALARGLPVWSEPELAWRLADGRTRLVAVTGTNGKTTTTELLARCLDAPTAGNIGTPLAEALSAPSPPRLVVAELSSFQLRFADTLRPDVAVLLNIAPDHLDWHGSMEAYRAAKARVWAAQGPADWVIVNADDDGARAAVEQHPPPGLVAWFTLAEPEVGEVGVEEGWIVQRLRDDAPERVAALDRMALRGPHNIANACAAAAAALVAGAAGDAVGAAIQAFGPGPHRMQVVAQAGGVTWVDDSKATNPHAAAAALAAYPSVVWIAGGLNKGLSFEPLHDVLAGRVRLALTIGTSAAEVAAMARAAGVEAVEVGTLKAAVARAAETARAGDTVLLSPACASMDQFRDYAERGTRFTALARDASARAQEASA
jgi:UDP-N-acetylmuramoylalanine--D-glutamate ligase